MSMNKIDRLSKEVSYALRHAPWEYELEIDDQGWVSVAQLLSALNEDYKWVNLKEEDLQRMVDDSEKRRHEISDGRIRAFNGHSIPMKIVKEEAIPPEFLYHGTAHNFLSKIEKRV